ncbi:LPS translocon maturation chaperone LptM [Litoribacillus peritrichatus]
MFSVTILSSSLLISGCGQKGGLYLPEETTQTKKTSEEKQKQPDSKHKSN